MLTYSRFILNGLKHANEILGEEAFVENDWKVIGEYVYDGAGGRHQAFYSPIRDTMVQGELIKAHERIQVEQSLKYSKEATATLWASAGMTQVDQWMTSSDEYGECISNCEILVQPGKDGGANRMTDLATPT